MNKTMEKELITFVVEELGKVVDTLIMKRDIKKDRWSSLDKITTQINSLRSIIEVMEVIEKWEEQ